MRRLRAAIGGTSTRLKMALMDTRDYWIESSALALVVLLVLLA